MEDIIKMNAQFQPVINIGLLGSVSNGKSVTVQKLTNIITQKFASEKKNNKSIFLGYANIKIYECDNCKPPGSYQLGPSNEYNKDCEICNKKMKLISHISFVDCPGHNQYMSTMINGSTIMDCAILIESITNIDIPASQTLEHIKASKIGNIKIPIICINKMDLIKKENIKNKTDQINKLKILVNEDAKIIPISASLKINFDILCYFLGQIKIPIRNLENNFKLLVVRSFDVNKPGTLIKNLRGGVIGGSIMSGLIKVGDKIELRPGFVNSIEIKKKISIYKFECKPYIAKIISIKSGDNELTSAIPGGLIGIQLDIDPHFSSKNKLVGQTMTLYGKGENIYEQIIVELVEIDIIIKKNMYLRLNINANNIDATVYIINNNVLTLVLSYPMCASINDKILICYNKNVIGTCILKDGLQVKIKS